MSTEKRTITIERTYRATLEEVWELWTTKEGIEAWWGPDGFSVVVGELDLRAGGRLHYVMTATAGPQVEFMKSAGMPLSTPLDVTFVEVTPPKRLAYTNMVTFVQGVEPYEVDTVVELEQRGDTVHLRLTIDAMHDETWTERAVMGWESELGRLAAALDVRRA